MSGVSDVAKAMARGAGRLDGFLAFPVGQLNGPARLRWILAARRERDKQDGCYNHRRN
jgi:hypothetical protein